MTMAMTIRVVVTFALCGFHVLASHPYGILSFTGALALTMPMATSMGMGMDMHLDMGMTKAMSTFADPTVVGKQVGTAGKFCVNKSMTMQTNRHTRLYCPKGYAQTGAEMDTWHSTRSAYIRPVTSGGKNGVDVRANPHGGGHRTVYIQFRRLFGIFESRKVQASSAEHKKTNP